MDETVEDCVGEGGVAEAVVPFLDRELAGDQGGPGGVSVLEEFEQVAAMVGIELGEAEVVEDEEVELGEGGEEFGIGAVAAGDGEVVQQPRQSQVQRGESVAAGLMGERTGEPGLSDAARSGDEDVEVLAQPAPAGKREDEGLVESAGVAEVDVLDAGVGMAQLRAARGRAPLDGYDRRYRAFTNMDFQTRRDHFEGFKHFDALLAAYGGKFILNTRPVDHWLRSMLHRSARKRWRDTHAARYGTGDPERVAECLRAEWEAHHRRVCNEIPPQRLLVFDIEADPPERLCDFVGVPRSQAGLYTSENRSFNVFGDWLDTWLPGPVKRAVPDRVKSPVKRLLRRR